ncbi:MAG: hypothetical protein MUF57_07235 [Gammaproteobacteria bacterium]|nr:hypothetical protein [Gammaproteobacteria bacterium]
MIGRGGWRLRRRDLRFLGVVVLNLAAIGAFLATESGAPETAVGGWRRIDRAALERRIESGERCAPRQLVRCLRTHDRRRL